MKQVFPLLPLIIWTVLVPSKANEFKCPGDNNYELSYCASQALKRSNSSLESQLKASTFEAWKSAIGEVCAEAYAPYSQGTIYPLMLMRCDENLNQTLLEEMKGLGERQ